MEEKANTSLAMQLVDYVVLGILIMLLYIYIAFFRLLRLSVFWLCLNLESQRPDEATMPSSPGSVRSSRSVSRSSVPPGHGSHHTACLAVFCL